MITKWLFPSHLISEFILCHLANTDCHSLARIKKGTKTKKVLPLNCFFPPMNSYCHPFSLSPGNCFFYSLPVFLYPHSLIYPVPTHFRSYGLSIHVLIISQFPLSPLFLLHPIWLPILHSLGSSYGPCSVLPQDLCICCSLCLKHSILSSNSFNFLLLTSCMNVEKLF